jgi:hypothetical protein
MVVAAFLCLHARRKRKQLESTAEVEPNLYGGSEKQATRRSTLNPALPFITNTQPLRRNPTTQSHQAFRNILDNPLAQNPVRNSTRAVAASAFRRILAAILTPGGTPGPPTPPPKSPPEINVDSPSSSHFSIQHPQPVSQHARMFHETWGDMRSQRPTPVQGEPRTSLHITISNGRLVRDGRTASWMFHEASDSDTSIHLSAGTSILGGSGPKK